MDRQREAERNRESPFDVQWELGAGPERAKPKLKIALRSVSPETPVERLPAWYLAEWLGLFSLSWVALVFVVPAFEQAYCEMGFVTPGPTDVILGASHLARSLPGLLMSVLVIVGSVLAVRKRRLTRYALSCLDLLAILFLGFMVLALFLPVLTNIKQKL